MKESPGDRYYRSDFGGQGAEAGLQEACKEQTGLCRAQSRLKHIGTRIGPMIGIVISDRVWSHEKYGKNLVAGIRIHRRRGTIGL